MFKDIRIENFRNINKVELKDIKGVNLITGLNGSGKSAILEGIFLNSQAGLIGSAIVINSIRGEMSSVYRNDRAFRTLFYDESGKTPATITASWRDHGRNLDLINRVLSVKPIPSSWKLTPQIDERGRSVIAGVEFDLRAGSKVHSNVKVQWREDIFSTVPNQVQIRGNQPQMQAAYSLQQDPVQSSAMLPATLLISAPREATVFIYNHLVNAVREKRVEDIIKFASLLDRRLIGLAPIVEDGMNRVYVDIGLDSLVPLSMMGTGFTNILQIAVTVAHIRGKIILIDEIEDGLHYTAFPSLSRAIIQSSKDSGVQFFITTHSGEFLDAFVDVAESEEFVDVCSFRIADRESEKTITRFDSDDLANAKEIELDIR